MGPLTHMLMMMRKNNEDEFNQFRATHPGWGNDEYARALFNSRLSSHPGGMMPGDNGGRIILDQAVDPEMPRRDWREVTPDFVGPPRQGMPPMSYRPPMQMGPEPPQGQLDMMARRMP